MQWLAKFIYHKVLGWKVTGNANLSKDNIKKAVIIAAPHTSWHDFYIGILLRSVLGVKTNFIGKKSLFNFPFGWVFRALGGAPVNRFSSQNKVKEIVKIFNERDEFRLGMSPEGTRKKTEKWRTGFYYIAKEANVPIIMFTLDFENKQNKISEPFYPTDDKDADFKFIKAYFNGVKGKIPEYS
ncbi:1-acyl-sn-glycerol-3-phosphate acyltransferase [Seonamhaeicola aphaedonensis]|uniref:1-acyl-sn-glycerol-3-phosphate acyltransferase n=1 Tax=Seonamhaeicola aphaedonensis TaxID=1461338 RepID=A0A3D9HIG7_9FLAO|nr:1-acyl-sn-glycerol-3-phosphate acyltransferase [Seonamhaeicola aphaedonensis]RED49332.1 1-acyl-sn-glycerol-3-phosphate acyltransferase [Seonamhaeicola aphaedonensis]